jgi:hypothetical protein
MLHELCEHQIALVHRSTLRNAASQGRKTEIRSSNRDQENPSLMRFSSTTYGSRKAKRWDTTEKLKTAILILGAHTLFPFPVKFSTQNHPCNYT